MKRVLFGLLVVCGAALAAAGVWLAVRPPAVPPELAERGAAYDVEILRDTWGVPHIFGKRDTDVAYGLAYAHAEDDFATIQGTLLAARGELARVHGEHAAPNDYMVHLLRIRDVVAAGYPELDAATRALCDAYADGINHYAALHPEQAVRDFYPVRGDDVVAGFVHKVPLFYKLDRVLGELFSDEGPEKSGGEHTRRDAAEEPAPMGSNAFAVAPSRSADGSTRLVVDPHQPWTGPVAWYEAHVRSEEGWDAVGALFPGAPVLLVGHNRDLGWSHTVNEPDLIDVFELVMDPEDDKRYRFGDEWRTLEQRVAPIEVSLWGPLSWTFEREVLWSEHGPVVQRPHGTYAIRLASYGEVGAIEQWYGMNKATTLESWKQAMRALAVPMFNTIYADREGNILYVYNARLPLRAEGYEWAGLLPGERAEVVWDEFLPFDRLPMVENPAAGFVQNCNSTPFETTSGADNPARDAYPASFGIELFQTNRAMRARALLEQDQDITADELLAIKFDTRYASDSRLAGFIAQIAAAPAPSEPALAEAVTMLGAWDLDASGDSEAAALAILAFAKPMRQHRDTIPTEELMASLAEAVEVLETHHGSIHVPLAELQRLRRGEVEVGLDGGPDTLRAIHADLEDGHLIGHAGDSHVMLVEWDAEGRVRSRSLQPYGNAKRDPQSPHYADQAALFAAHALKPVWYEEADIRRNLERAYVPGEEERAE
ncbi:acylase [Haliangium ochraceum]|uniref:Glutaryl-7-aminocephalosporanic-acid acylase n=1 Tax=Haliangium ochraceum (strain DSM 14365 / JCM 11303 / SMP-2) TaxID=502025 RepID=D0LX31_HALO1|nr:acylase [Haliangium ochraceum]ACY16073.1 Glutaryl-7-aminocephalosporanic-acid acylase [Haliangium ochraceum DSM 14365]